MKLIATITLLTQITCVIAICMCAFSLETGKTHFESKRLHEWGKQELVSTCIALLCALVLLAFLSLAKRCSPRVCCVLTFIVCAASCFTLTNLLTAGLMLVCYFGWVHIVAFEHHQTGISPELLAFNNKNHKPVEKPSVEVAWKIRTGRIIQSLCGLFGLTIMTSFVVFALRFQEFADRPLTLRVAKAAGRGMEPCLFAYVLPSVERIVPRRIQLFMWMPKFLRIKDVRLAKRSAWLGTAYAVVHVLAHFTTFVQVCNSDLLNLSMFITPVAWVTGFLLVWALVIVYVLSTSPELRYAFHRVSRIGHFAVLAVFLLHLPIIYVWVTVFAAMLVLDHLLLWWHIIDAYIYQCKAFPEAGITHLHIAAWPKYKISMKHMDKGGMVNLQVLQNGTAFQPLYVFRVPGDDPNTFHCLIKSRAEGWTEELQNTVAYTKQVRNGTRVFIDGPHHTLTSSTRTISKYPQLLLLANGEGITVPLSILSNLHVATEQDKPTYLHLDWSLRASDLPAFACVLQYLRTWQVSSLPHFTFIITLSDCKDENDVNLLWLREQANQGDFKIKVGYEAFDQIFTEATNTVGFGSEIGIFGCGSREYYALCKEFISKHQHMGIVRFYNFMESM